MLNGQTSDPAAPFIDVPLPIKMVELSPDEGMIPWLMCA